ncbi:MAG: hypothetical protein QGH40_15775 [bacterium]|jgi:hypothetical protein|nr:hypothetical protein [bacterium]
MFHRRITAVLLTLVCFLLVAGCDSVTLELDDPVPTGFVEAVFLVSDQLGNPVGEASVSVDGYFGTAAAFTTANGTAFLAVGVDDQSREVTYQVSKSGYQLFASDISLKLGSQNPYPVQVQLTIQ